MYDRYTITLKSDELALTLGVEVPHRYNPQYNAAPTKKLPVITSHQNQKLSFFYWGLISRWSNNKAMSHKLFNLPIDSVLTKVAYKRKLRTHRCVIPMDGFYVWKQIAKKRQVPHYFYFPDHRVFSVAGIWEEYDDTEDAGKSFIMITKPSANVLSDFQEDMPAILDAVATRKWLESEDLTDIKGLLANDQSSEFISHTVSPKIRDIAGNDVAYVNHAPASDQHGNYTLFT